MLLLSSLLAPSAFAGRYVLDQTPATIEGYFGPPLELLPASQSHGNEKTYLYSTATIRRLFPDFPKDGQFAIGFVNDRVQSIWLEPNAIDDESFAFGQREAAMLFHYIFGYEPPLWQPIALPFGGGGHEGFADNKACLGDGVGTTYISYMRGEANIRLYYDPACEAR